MKKELDHNNQDCLQVPDDPPIGKHATWETWTVLADKESVLEETDEIQTTKRW